MDTTAAYHRDIDVLEKELGFRIVRLGQVAALRCFRH